MQKFQRFIVSWTSKLTGEHYSEYNSLEEATLKYDQLKKISSDEYVYLSVVIDYEQLIYHSHWYTVAIIKPTKQQHRGIQDDSTRRGTNWNTGIRNIPLDES